MRKRAGRTENFGHQMALNNTLKFGSLLLNFTNVDDEQGVEKYINELQQFATDFQMGNHFYQTFDAHVLKLSIRKHRYQGKEILESRSHVFRGIFLQVVRKDYYEAHQCFRAAMALSSFDRTLNVYTTFSWTEATDRLLRQFWNGVEIKYSDSQRK